MNKSTLNKRWLAALGVLLGLLVVLPAAAQQRGQNNRETREQRQARAAERKAAADKAKADKAAADKAKADKPDPADAAEPATEGGGEGETFDPAEMAQKLLAQREQKLGPTFPGKDPAFLVLPRPTERGDMANRLLTPQVREMTERALAYLASKQEADGSWSDAKFESNTGVTALCVLAFMSEGSRPRVGKYGRQIDSGIEFILKNAQTSGVLAGGKSNPYGPGYEHALSTLALIYAYGDSPRHPEIRDTISKAIQAILRSQRLDGGWRYEFTREGHSDMSVTANVLWVLRAAKKAGYTVAADAIDKGVRFVEKCAMPDGTFRYRVWGIHASPSLGGTGIIALCNQGRMDHMLIPRARDRIDYDYKRYTIEDLRERRYFTFGCFYASLAMYMCGDEYWIPWHEKAVKVLASIQRKDGEFPEQWDNDPSDDCTVYSTAMAAMILQAPLGYLPIYER